VPAAGVGEDLLPYLVDDRLDVAAMRDAMKNMVLVQVETGVLPATQKDAEQLGEDVPEGEEDVLAAEWFTELRLHPAQHSDTAAAARTPLPIPVAPWMQGPQTVHSVAGAPLAGAAAAAEAIAAAEATAAAEAPSAGAAVAGGAASTQGAAPVGEAPGPSHAAVAAAGVGMKVGGHSRASLDVAAATGTGTAVLGKRTHASRRGATYAELVQPVHGDREWQVYRRLLRNCTTRKGVDWQRLGDMWDEEMEDDPALTPKSTTTLKAAERVYADYLALKHSVCAMQEGDAAPTGRGAAAAGSSTSAAQGAATMVIGAGVSPILQVPQGAVGIGQLVRTVQGQHVLLQPAALGTQQLAQATLAAAAAQRPVLLPQFGAVSAGISPQMLAAAACLPGQVNQAALILQQQLQQQAFLQQQQRQLMQQQLMQQQLMQQGQQWLAPGPQQQTQQGQEQQGQQL